MTARVLVVDDIAANVKLLQARLTAEYFEVLTASNGQQAIDTCNRERVDVVLLDVMMPGLDGFEVLQRLKANPKTHHIPVIMVTALDEASDKRQGLNTGADDFLVKPVDDIALVTRVKNLARLKALNDEMLMRAGTGRQMGLAEGTALDHARSYRSGRIVVVDDHARSAARLIDVLAKTHNATTEPDPEAALLTAAGADLDLMIVSLSLEAADALRLCARVRSQERSRHLPIIVLADPGDEARLLRGLDMGINDYIMRPVDYHELQARVRTQIRRKRYSDYLRNRLDESVELSITDALTGLFNRHYMECHLQTLVGDALKNGRALSIMIADIDHFKHVNDTYGHAAGDSVLRDFSARFRRNTRGADLACRLGGEEFVVVMPDTDISRAYQIGERLRAAVASEAFQVSPEQRIVVTASVGLATLARDDDTPESLLKRADAALYSSKNRGRNRVSTAVA